MNFIFLLDLLMISSLKPLILSGPSGCGKSTLIGHLLTAFPNKFELTVSHTTRKPRINEKEGFHYYFVSKSHFENMISKDEFLEFEEVHGKYYGTSKNEIVRILNKSVIPILDIDINGAININKNCKISAANYLFITTKNISTLKQRLSSRGTETEESLNLRILNAETEINKAKLSNIYQKNDYIINEDLAETKTIFLNKIRDLYKI